MAPQSFQVTVAMILVCKYSCNSEGDVKTSMLLEWQLIWSSGEWKCLTMFELYFQGESIKAQGGKYINNISNGNVM